MKKLFLLKLALFQFTAVIALSSPSLGQEWAFHRPRGTIRVVDLYRSSVSVMQNYAEGLVTLDKDNNFIPCLAKDWRWIDDRTIEFKLREDVRFHNGEKFNAEAVRINWEAYRSMKAPRPYSVLELPDETVLSIISDNRVRFTFPEPEGLAFVKLRWFFQIAPAFFADYHFDENNYGYLPTAGPWGTGPFEFVEGTLRYGKPGERIVLEAYEDYWEPRYPRVKRIIFDNTLLGDREGAMALCMEKEGRVDIVSKIRPLDTLKVAESPYAKVVKSKDATLLMGILNERRSGSKWLDIRLRQALNLAINREELWKYGAKGNARNLGGHIPPETYGHNPNLTIYAYDTEKARALIAKAGYPNGFEIKMIAAEAWKLEAQIITKMLERVGLKAKLEVLSFPELNTKIHIPGLDRPLEEQDWDIVMFSLQDWYGNTAASFVAFGLVEASDYRWIKHDPVYEEMWEDMARTVAPDLQEDKIRQLEKYLYDQAYNLFVYSPLSLYAVNKQVDFVPHGCGFLCLHETSVTEKHWSVRVQDK